MSRISLIEATMLALQHKLNEDFWQGVRYKVVLVNGDTFEWKPSKDYANQDFIEELKQLNSDIKSFEDIESINRIDF